MPPCTQATITAETPCCGRYGPALCWRHRTKRHPRNPRRAERAGRNGRRGGCSTRMESTTINPSFGRAVRRTGRDDAPVKFFSIHRDEYPQLNKPADLLTGRTAADRRRLHPFLHVAPSWSGLFEEAGYRIRKRLFRHAVLPSLYIAAPTPRATPPAATAPDGFFAPAAARRPPRRARRGWSTRPQGIGQHGGQHRRHATPQTPTPTGEAIPELCKTAARSADERNDPLHPPTLQVSRRVRVLPQYTTDHR